MATGETLAWFTAHDNVPPSSNYATFDTRNNHGVLDFDDSSDEEAVFEAVMPTNYSGQGIDVTIVWMATSATTDSVVWGAQFERHADDAFDLDSDSFDSAQEATGTAPSASGEVSYDTISFTNAQIDGVVAGESYRLKVYRDADAGGDTMTGDAELLRVIVDET